MFHSESTFTKNGQPAADLEVAIGITTHGGRADTTMNSHEGWMSCWEKFGDSDLGTGVFVDPWRIREMRVATPRDDENHALILAKTDEGGRIDHFAGFAWTKAGKIESRDQWHSYLADLALRLRGFRHADISPKSFPEALEKVDSFYTARSLALSWRDPQEAAVGIVYAPLKEVPFTNQLSSLLKPRIKAERPPITPAPSGYFIAFAKNGTAWLITVLSHLDFVRITRLKHAADADDPDFSKLYWEDWDEPRFEARSPDLYELWEKENERR
ncbi:MAG: DUF4861 family protein, partial [Chthoniobacteraceae bacterium]